MVKRTAVIAALVLALMGCGNDDRCVSCHGKEAPASYVPGQAVDGEDYNGPTQTVTTKTIDPEKRDVKTERYCITKKNGVCKAYGVKTKYVVTDDLDHILGLPDGTPVDVDEKTWRRYNIGDPYP
jgi:hypothetical protein